MNTLNGQSDTCPHTTSHSDYARLISQKCLHKNGKPLMYTYKCPVSHVSTQKTSQSGKCAHSQGQSGNALEHTKLAQSGTCSHSHGWSGTNTQPNVHTHTTNQIHVTKAGRQMSTYIHKVSQVYIHTHMTIHSCVRAGACARSRARTHTHIHTQSQLSTFSHTNDQLVKSEMGMEESQRAWKWGSGGRIWPPVGIRERNPLKLKAFFF